MKNVIAWTIVEVADCQREWIVVRICLRTWIFSFQCARMSWRDHLKCTAFVEEGCSRLSEQAPSIGMDGLSHDAD